MSKEPVTTGQWVSPDAPATMALGSRLAALLRAGDVVALVGQLGAGKTQLVRGLAVGLGLDEAMVSSPTFVLMQEYPATADSSAMTLVHIDAYRLAGSEEFAEGLWGDDGAEVKRDAAVVIEWAEVVEAALGDDGLWLELEHDAAGRRIRWDCRGSWVGRARDVARCFEH